MGAGAPRLLHRRQVQENQGPPRGRCPRDQRQGRALRLLCEQMARIQVARELALLNGRTHVLGLLAAITRRGRWQRLRAVAAGGDYAPWPEGGCSAPSARLRRRNVYAHCLFGPVEVYPEECFLQEDCLSLCLSCWSFFKIA